MKTPFCSVQGAKNIQLDPRRQSHVFYSDSFVKKAYVQQVRAAPSATFRTRNTEIVPEKASDLELCAVKPTPQISSS
jgi:hypothetical protein